MMELPINNVQGQEVGRREVPESLFAVPMNLPLVHQAMVMYQANQRQGTSSTKTRAQVSGGGRKPHPQKGTGRARQGSTRTPQSRSGGVVFGPHPRSHRLKMPQKMRRLALRCLLSEKVRAGRLTVVQDLALSQPQTKEMTKILKNLGITSPALIVLGNPDPPTVRSVRNIPRVKTLAPELLNALDLLRFDHVVIAVEAVDHIERLWDRIQSRSKNDSEVDPEVPVGKV
jgi:large subunit ribosomal protein L4